MLFWLLKKKRKHISVCFILIEATWKETELVLVQFELVLSSTKEVKLPVQARGRAGTAPRANPDRSTRNVASEIS